MTADSYYELSDVDEVARMREVRRAQEQQFASVEAYFDWIANLQRQHDRRGKSGAVRRAGAPKQRPRNVIGRKT